MSTIGFIGLGNMGLPMATNLVNAGHHVKAFDTVSSAIDVAVKRGMEITSSVAEASTDVDMIITMLPNGSIVTSVFEEALLVAKSSTVFVDCSTIDVSSALKTHQMTSDSEHTCLDSPVSGGVTGATAGTLTLMVGGDEEVFNHAKDILSVVAGRLVHCGKGGAGQSAKICNNMLLGITMIGLSEAFVLGKKLGLEPQALYDVMSSSSGSCWSLLNYCPVEGLGKQSPADNNFKPGFAAELMLKDLNLSQLAANEVAAATPMGSHATEFYQRFNDAGFGEMDFSAVIKQLADLKRN